MGDTKRGRDKQARDQEERQRKWELEQERERGDEAEPERDDEDASREAADDGAVEAPTCHRRGCDERATFRVLERYEEETGHGAVEATAALCSGHAAEEHPTNVDGAYADYVFRVDPIAETDRGDED